jgi:hypothetical protein
MTTVTQAQTQAVTTSATGRASDSTQTRTHLRESVLTKQCSFEPASGIKRDHTIMITGTVAAAIIMMMIRVMIVGQWEPPSHWQPGLTRSTLHCHSFKFKLSLTRSHWHSGSDSESGCQWQCVPLAVTPTMLFQFSLSSPGAASHRLRTATNDKLPCRRSWSNKDPWVRRRTVWARSPAQCRGTALSGAATTGDIQVQVGTACQ